MNPAKPDPAQAPRGAPAKNATPAQLQKQISDLHDMLTKQDERTGEVENHRDDLSSKLDTERQMTASLNRRLTASHEQFAELKERLFNAEILCARQQGYIERVASDDIARDEPVTVGTRTLAELQPRRPRPPFGAPQPAREARPSYMAVSHERQGGTLGDNKSGHWTTWGPAHPQA